LKTTQVLLSIAPRGERALVSLGGDFRKALTVTLVVAADGTRLRPTVIKRGLTKRAVKAVEAKHGDAAVWCWSKSGWSNLGVLDAICRDVITPHTGGAPCVLLIDVAPAHTKRGVVAILRRHNITPRWVPPNSTPRCQPLDCNPNSVLKSKARSAWREARLTDPAGKIGYVEAIDQLLAAYAELSDSAIHKGWCLALDVGSVPPSPRPTRQLATTIAAVAAATAEPPLRVVLRRLHTGRVDTAGKPIYRYALPLAHPPVPARSSLLLRLRRDPPSATNQPQCTLLSAPPPKKRKPTTSKTTNNKRAKR
jgi:hypothetical protein